MIHKRHGNRFFMPDGWEEKIEKAICPVCNKPNKRQFRCCSKECTTKFWKTEGVFWSFQLKDMCFKRDDNTCQKCGANNKAYEEHTERFFAWAKKWRGIKLPPGIHTEGGFKQWFNDKTGNYTNPGEHYQAVTGDKEPEKIYFECDHIVPIALGGDEYDLKNLQTLCDKCHKRKTAGEGKDFARARKNQLTLTESLKDGKQSFIKEELIL